MLDFFFMPGTVDTIWILIVLTGVVTYITRSAGHVVLARFKSLNPRAEAALEAVPAAVLVTLVLPPLLSNGPLEVAAMLAAFAASFRLSPIGVLTIGMVIVVFGRALGW